MNRGVRGSLLEEKTFEYLFSKYFHRMDAYAFRFVQSKDISKDIVQEAFIHIWEKRDKIHKDTFENLLFVTVRNRCLNHIRKYNSQEQIISSISQSATLEELCRIDMGAEEYSPLEIEELESEYKNILKKLPQRCREVFIMSRHQGLKNREIAEELNINIKNVERHISSALKIFRRELGNRAFLFTTLL